MSSNLIHYMIFRKKLLLSFRNEGSIPKSRRPRKSANEVKTTSKSKTYDKPKSDKEYIEKLTKQK